MNTDPPPIVRSINEEKTLDQMDAFELHNKSQEFHKVRSSNLILMAKVWCLLDDQNGYEKLDAGYQSIYEYIAKYTGKSKATARKIMSVWRRYVEELGADEQTIIDSDYNRLSIMQSQVDSDNLDEVLENVAEKSQAELREMVKESKGLEPEENEIDEETTVLKFKGSKDNMAVIKTALEMSKEEYVENSTIDVKNVSNFQALEILAANYMTSRSLTGEAADSYDEILNRFAKVNGLKIEWKKNVETDA